MKLIRRLLNTVFSLITTCLIMVSPVAAMVYASEPVTAIERFSIRESAAVKHIDSEKTVNEFARQPEKREIKNSNQAALTGKE